MNRKTIVLAIIVIFIGSIILSMASFIGGPNPGGSGSVIDKIETHKNSVYEDVIPGRDTIEQSLEGVVRKLDASFYMEGTHYLEADGISLSLLESTSGLNLDKYIGKNVEVWGTSRRTVEGDGTIMDVERVDRR